MNNEEIIQRINELREKRGKNLKSPNENVCETDANADLNMDVAVNLAEKSGASSAANLNQKSSPKPSVVTLMGRQSIKDADLRAHAQKSLYAENTPSRHRMRSRGFYSDKKAFSHRNFK